MVEMQTELLEMIQSKVGELTEKSTYPMHSVDTFLSFVQTFGSAEDIDLAEQIARVDSIKALGWFLVKNHVLLSPKMEPMTMVVENVEFKQVSNL